MREIGIAVVLALIIILFAYQPVKVEGGSMLPALQDSERLFINKFIYRSGIERVERGDMIVFEVPTARNQCYIKRVIALPGDIVELRSGAVWLNGVQIAEPFIPAEYRDNWTMTPLRVPDAQYFVLGDHRCASNDSRILGPIPRQAIYGKAVFAYWPLNRLGTLR